MDVNAKDAAMSSKTDAFSQATTLVVSNSVFYTQAMAPLHEYPVTSECERRQGGRG